jgi:putative nucleotidyltransferase with HDIG domain
MNVTHPFRWRILVWSFLVLSGACIGTLLLQQLAEHLEWSGQLPWILALLIALVLSIVITIRLTWQSRELTISIASRSLHHAERQTHALHGTTYAEAAVEWSRSLRTLQDSFLESQSEARKQYSALVELMSMMARAVDERATFLRGHSERVSQYAGEIAREMQLDSAQVDRVRLSGLVHDIGNIGVDDSIMTKDLPLSPEEFEIVKAHTVKGASILRPIEALNDLIPGIELHHEALDGRGYPYGLQGDQVPMLARVIAVADTFDALTTNRPYQHAHTPEQALQIIKNLAGKRLDPEAVEALLAVYERGEIKIQRFTIKRPIAPQPAETPAPAVAGAPVATPPQNEIATLERTRV